MMDKELERTLKRYQEQTCGNFSDINDDMDDVRGHFLQIESTLDAIIQRLNKMEGNTMTESKFYCPVCRKRWTLAELMGMRCPACDGKVLTEEQNKASMMSFIRTDGKGENKDESAGSN